MLYCHELDVFCDSGYFGADKRPKAEANKAQWHVAIKPDQDEGNLGAH